MVSQPPVRVAACIVTFHNPVDQVVAAAQSFRRVRLTNALTIVDNHSGPDYAATLRGKVNAHVIESGANRGFGFGHNIGLRHAPACDYYLVLNPDVVIHDGALEAMVEHMDAQPDIGLLSPRVLNPDGSLQPLNKRLPTVFDLFARRFLPRFVQHIPFIKRRMDYYTMQDVGYGREVDVEFATGCFMLFRKSVLDKVGGFDEGFFMYLEDADITRRLSRHARAVYFPQAVITHHWARGAHKSWRLMLVAIQSARYYFTKWGWRWI